MRTKDFYTQSHLIVAAMRVFEYKNGEAPTVRDICSALSISLEQGHLIVKKLSDMDILNMVKGPFDTRIFIKDHIKLEDIPKGTSGPSLKEEVEKFKTTKKDFKKEIESFQTKKEQEQKELFAKIEEKLKKGTTK